MPTPKYEPKAIEPKWQKTWDKDQTYKADLDSKKPKYFAMSMFNYPSGSGIHIGHAMNYTISDVFARFKRQQGHESYHPVGWDAFGLPAENYAIRSGTSPQASMRKIIPFYHKQYKAMGWSNDWSKEISTHDPSYYKWTQWIFSEMYRNKLAYQDSRLQWWCSIDNTVLADEQVTAEGKCWRHDSPEDPPVEKKEVKQWFFKITDYAEELLKAIPKLEWTESVKVAQTNWIGKSEGAEIDFQLEGSQEKIKVFTTRPDTIFGATFLVLAPEHELVEKITTPAQKSKITTYQDQVAKKSDIQRQTEKQKTGVFTGAYATNPANHEKVPIWVAEYVLSGYGTGAIMAVPAHDERDFEFATQHKLPIVQVIAPKVMDTGNPPRAEKQFTKRRVVMCLVKHPSQDKYLTLKWRQLPWHTFIMGGVEDSEDPMEAGLREISEETGFKNAEFVRNFPHIINSHFYAAHKDVNRDVMMHIMEFSLSDLEKTKAKLEKHEDFEVVWTTKKDLATLGPVSELPYILRWLKEGDYAISDEGVVLNSGKFDGLSSEKAGKEIVADLAKSGQADAQILYRLQDWSVSRQRYWGAPIPIVHCPDCGPVLVPDKDLPVILPELKNFQPTGDGRSALARAKEWLKVTCPDCGKPAERETDTLDTYIDSSWYFLRYLDPQNDKKIFDPTTVDHWMPVDFYNGADHATAHMIYARFITRFFSKQKLLKDPEPFKKFLFNGKVVGSDGKNFSKTKKNGPDPLDIINQGYGADAVRTYLMFAAPLDQWVRWDPQGVPGTYRFLTRLWNITYDFTDQKADKTDNDRVLKSTHKAIAKVTKDIESLKYNTAIATLMQLVNELYLERDKNLYQGTKSWQFALESAVQLVAPFAPHLSEELWRVLGHQDSVHIGHWPTLDHKWLKSDEVNLVVQINGKTRSTIAVKSGTSESELIKLIEKNAKLKKYLVGKKTLKKVFIPDRLINFVVK